MVQARLDQVLTACLESAHPQLGAFVLAALKSPLPRLLVERWGRTLGSRDLVSDGLWCVRCLDYEELPDRRQDQLAAVVRDFARTLPKEQYDAVVRRGGTPSRADEARPMGRRVRAGSAPFTDQPMAKQGRRPIVSGTQDYHYTYPVAVAIGCAIALGVVLFTVALVRALVNDPDLIAPSADQAEQKAAHRACPGEFAPDLAWPLYPFRQSRADVARVRRNVAANNATIWRQPARWFFRDAKGWWVLVPTASAAASRVVLVPTAALLRFGERARRSRLRTDAACMRCFHVTPWPAYQCPACLRPHHDVQPGRLGVFFRRCTCGAHLPTRASRAAVAGDPALPAVRGVRWHPARVPSGTSASQCSATSPAGKTRFLYASLNSLVATAAQAGST